MTTVAELLEALEAWEADFSGTTNAQVPADAADAILAATATARAILEDYA